MTTTEGHKEPFVSTTTDTRPTIHGDGDVDVYLSIEEPRPRVTGSMYGRRNVTIEVERITPYRHRDDAPLRFTARGHVLKKDGEPGLQRQELTLTVEEMDRILPGCERIVAQARVEMAQRLLAAEQAALASLG